MSLALPAIADLSEDQHRVLELPLSENHLVVGGPGTGKSVLALHRASAMVADGQRVAVLMFNRMLCNYTHDSAEASGLPLEWVSTFHEWFRSFFEEQFDQPPPMRSQYDPDYDACIAVAREGARPGRGPVHVLVDEGQDLPMDAYQFIKLTAASVTVFADDNQRIREEINSTLDDLELILQVDHRVRLTTNYRNSKQVAELAAFFDPRGQGGVQNLQRNPPPGAQPRLLTRGLPEVVTYIVGMMRRRPSLSIGVLLPTVRAQQQYFDLLDEAVNADERLGALAESKRPQVGFYASQWRQRRGRRPVDFNSSGPKIINYQSAKGLQFDIVVLPSLEAWDVDLTGAHFQRMMYVLCSRARLGVALAYGGAGEPAIRSHLPLHLLREMPRRTDT